MNAPASHTLPSHAERAQAFAANVRSALSDLPADELDELLDGLGADLEERLAEGGELGDPQQYAEELRAAAGLPPFDPSQQVKARQTMRERIDTAGASIATWLSETPGRRGFRDFMATLRPVWWVARAVIVVWALMMFIGHPVYNGFPISAPSFFLTLATIVLSVQWGRGKWLPNKWIRGLRTAGNWAAAVLTLPFLLIGWNGFTAGPQYIYEEGEPSPGLYSNGQSIENIFAYDCEGNPIDLVRLYDQRGEPITTTIGEPYGSNLPPDFWNEDEQTNYSYNFNPLAKDAEAWNAFPLSASKHLDDGGYGPSEPIESKRGELPPLSRDCTVEGATGDGATSESGEAPGEAGEATAEGTDSAVDPAKPAEQVTPEVAP